MIADNLSKYAYNLKYNDLSKSVIHEVKRRFIDSIGCAIASENSKPVKIAKKITKPNLPALKAFLYGTRIRYLDYNDSYISKDLAHPSDNIGGVLGVAEFEKSNGRDVILATALAYEIQCRLCDAASLRIRGWDHVIYGLPATGLAAGKLMNLPLKKLTQITNLTLTTYLSSREVREGTELSMWKACAFANVARNSIFAAKFAKEGMTGPNEVFEGKFGLMNQITGPFKLDIKRFGKRKGHFKILDCWIKKWPAEIHSQSAIQASLELRKNIKISEISKINIETHKAGYIIIGSGKEKWNPKTRETADHSLPYIVGAALMNGKIDMNTYSEKKIKDKKLLALVKKISAKENPRLTKLYPRMAANIVRIKLKSGKVLEKRVDYHRGHPKNPMSDREVENKFNSLTRNFISKKDQKDILKFIWNLEKQKSISQLLKFLK
ncbi:MAG: MmgE/PrpD family protein [Nanoarchaeota archaeon]